MNFESGFSTKGTSLDLIDEEEMAQRKRRRTIIIALVVAGLVLIGAWLMFGRGGGKPADAEKGGKQAPTVTVVVPGRQTVDRIVSATGNLAARREMPVGVAGEGGMVSAVLVEPGQWVGAGQVLATIDRRVQAQQEIGRASCRERV